MAVEPESARVMQEPPRMFSRPTEPPRPIEPIRSGEFVTKLHATWSRPYENRSSWSNRIRSKSRSAIERLLGRADHELIGDLIRAVDAVAARCDEISARLSQLEIITNEVAETLGPEVTRLTAEVGHLASRGPITANPPTHGE
jgi:hypothetical protein